MESTDLLKVYNYSGCYVFFTAGEKTYKFAPAEKDKPSTQYIPFEKFETAESHHHFECGILVIDEKQRDEAYQKIGIANAKDILYAKDIDTVILNPTAENLEKIASIQDGQVIELVNTRRVCLSKNRGIDISSRMDRCIQERHSEIRRGVKNPRFKSPAQPVNNIASLTAENQELKSRLEALESLVRDKFGSTQEETKKAAVGKKDAAGSDKPVTAGKPRTAKEK